MRRLIPLLVLVTACSMPPVQETYKNDDDASQYPATDNQPDSGADQPENTANTGSDRSSNPESSYEPGEEPPWRCNNDTDCEDKNPCTENICLPSGDCVFSPQGGSCDDENSCTLGDSCTGGVCTGTFKVCEDGNYCTDDFCDPNSGNCTHSPGGGTCEDGDACSVDDYCLAGKCTAGSDKDCSDGNLCTVDACTPVTGECTHEIAADDLGCDNGDACTTNDICKAGVCEAGDPKDCNDNSPCTEETCISEEGGCVYNNIESECEDGNLCTAGDKCKQGQCAAGESKECSDENICTDDVCDPFSGNCKFVKNAADCDDGNPCTSGDKCSETACLPGKKNSCDDGDACTDDACEKSDGQCTHTNNQATCEDGNLCTLGDSCIEGNCESGEAKACDDNNPCTKDSCNTFTGQCVFTPNEDPCEDDDACTLDDKCKDSTCSGGTPMDCDDGDSCTEGEACVKGVCTKGSVKNCDDDTECTVDECIDEQGGCVFTPVADGTYCFASWCVKSMCEAGKCVSDGEPDCNDNNPCTDDACVANVGCQNKPKDCDDATDCTLDSCDEVTGDCLNTPDNGKCDDNIACSINKCVSGTGCVNEYPEGCCSIALQEDFEKAGTPSGWSVTGTSTTKWKTVLGNEAKAGSGALYYGITGSWNFSTGASNNGKATSPEFTIPSNPTAKLKMAIWMDVELNTTYDKFYVRLKPQNTIIFQKNGKAMKTWHDVSFALAAYQGQKTRIELDFNTIDAAFNSYKGIFVDEIVVSSCDL